MRGVWCEVVTAQVGPLPVKDGELCVKGFFEREKAGFKDDGPEPVHLGFNVCGIGCTVTVVIIEELNCDALSSGRKK